LITARRKQAQNGRQGNRQNKKINVCERNALQHVIMAPNLRSIETAPYPEPMNNKRSCPKPANPRPADVMPVTKGLFHFPTSPSVSS
jgi:hypothetical protein